MGKHKGQKKSKKQKKKNSIHAGFSQRTHKIGARFMEPSYGFAERKSQPSWLSALGQTAKHLGGKVLDGLAMVQPELAPLRALVKAHYGFAERDVEAQGGSVVKVEDAPVAFARNPVQTGLSMLGKTRAGQVMWLRDQVSGTLTTASTASTFANGAKFLTPVESTLFPNFYQEFLYWNRWRPLKAVLHYCHFAPTATQAAVMLGYFPLPNIAAGALPMATTNQFMGNQFAIQGSAYEDLAIEIEDPQWKEGTWFGNYTTATSTGTGGFNGTGYLGWATDANVPTSQAIGYLYVELIFEVCDRRPLYNGAGLMSEARLAFEACTNDKQFDAVCRVLQDKLIAQIALDKKQLLGPVGHAHEAPNLLGEALRSLKLDETRVQPANLAPNTQASPSVTRPRAIQLTDLSG